MVNDILQLWLRTVCFSVGYAVAVCVTRDDMNAAKRLQESCEHRSPWLFEVDVYLAIHTVLVAVEWAVYANNYRGRFVLYKRKVLLKPRQLLWRYCIFVVA